MGHVSLSSSIGRADLITYDSVLSPLANEFYNRLFTASRSAEIKNIFIKNLNLPVNISAISIDTTIRKYLACKPSTNPDSLIAHLETEICNRKLDPRCRNDPAGCWFILGKLSEELARRKNILKQEAAKKEAIKQETELKQQTNLTEQEQIQITVKQPVTFQDEIVINESSLQESIASPNLGPIKEAFAELSSSAKPSALEKEVKIGKKEQQRALIVIGAGIALTVLIGAGFYVMSKKKKK